MHCLRLAEQHATRASRRATMRLALILVSKLCALCGSCSRCNTRKCIASNESPCTALSCPASIWPALTCSDLSSATLPRLSALPCASATDLQVLLLLWGVAQRPPHTHAQRFLLLLCRHPFVAAEINLHSNCSSRPSRLGLLWRKGGRGTV